MAFRSRFPSTKKAATERARDCLILSDGKPAKRAIAWHGVPLGEILFGHTNAHHEKAPGPMVLDKTIRRATRV